MATSTAPQERSSPLDRLLDAAERVVVEVGAAHLTLNAVARAAGVSKGGLLYHFPSKEVLLQAMVERHNREVDARIAGLGSVAERLRERVRMMLELAPKRRAVGAGLVAACAINPALMATCRERYREIIDELSQLPGGFERAALILLAVDGLILGELLHVSPYTPAERAQLAAALRHAAGQYESQERAP